jgi:hypothetical protein
MKVTPFLLQFSLIYFGMAGILSVLTKSKAWQWIVNLSTVVKVFTIFVPLIIGGFYSYNRHIIKKYEKEKADRQQSETVQKMDAYFNVVKDSLFVFSREIRSIKPELQKTNSKLDIVKTQLGNHIVKTSNDKRDILNWINAFEEKKNPSTSMIQSSLNKNEYVTPQLK